MAVRFCDYCGEPIGDGHVLEHWYKYHYYCDEDCLRKENTSLNDMSMEEMYDKEIQYYTTWYDDSPYDLTKCYKIGDDYFFNFKNTNDDSLSIYWVIINYDEWISADSFKKDTKGVVKLFNSLDEGKEYYTKHYVE